MNDVEIILQNILTPKKNLYVVWISDTVSPKRIWKIRELGTITAIISPPNSSSGKNVPLFELRQIVGEFRNWAPTPPGEFTTDSAMYRLPIRPKDLEWAVQHLGEKVNCKKEDFALGEETRPSPGMYVTEIQYGMWLKIIPPPPTDDELWKELTEGFCPSEMLSSISYNKFKLIENMKGMLHQAKIK